MLLRMRKFRNYPPGDFLSTMLLRVVEFVSVLLVHLSSLCSPYRILHLPMPARSHLYSQYYIGRELIRRGHEVHILVHWSIPIPDEWMETIKSGKMFFHVYGNTSETLVNFDDGVQKMTWEILTEGLGPQHFLFKMIEFNAMIERDLILDSDKLMEHLESLNLDTIILDYALFIKPHLYVAHRLKLPVITYWDMVEPWLVRMPWMPSIYGILDGVTEISSTFCGRLFNSIKILLIALLPPFEDPKDNLLDKFRQYGEFEGSEKIISNSLLFLVPQDPVLDYVRPLTANVVFVGGLTTEALRTSEASLPPKDYSDFMENDQEGDLTNLGTVVVSFGTMVKKYPDHFARVFLEAFNRLSHYKFVWRFENYLNLSIPANVKITQWLPQKELLGHPSVKLFITHSGNNGQFEAVYQGVPMLAVYLLADQPRNARRIVDKGYGLMLDFRTLEVEQLIESIENVIRDPSYKERVVKASKIFKSRPDTPAQRAAFWIEHVIRFGADHLKPIGNDLTFWQYLCLDVLLFIEFFLFASLVLTAILVRKCFIKLFHKVSSVRNGIYGNGLKKRN